MIHWPSSGKQDAKDNDPEALADDVPVADHRIIRLAPSRLLRTQSRPQWCSLTTAIMLINYNEQQAVRLELNTPEE